GKITYRVVRTADRPATAASAGHPVGTPTGNDLVDPAPPAATDLYYTVFSRRDEGAWSPAASSPPVRCLPELADVRLAADEHTVRGSWSAHADVAETEVVRLDDGRAVKSAREGFTDADVVPGTVYRYRIRAVYRPRSGGREVTAGVEAEVAPESAHREVEEVTVTAEGQNLARISWTVPASGRVVIRWAESAPSWTPGDTLTVAEAERYGSELPGVPVPDGPGRECLTAPLGPPRRYFAAVTVGGG
ncbi:hypothetical protein, partial [Actinocorallia lasiicapitis]